MGLRRGCLSERIENHRVSVSMDGVNAGLVSLKSRSSSTCSFHCLFSLAPLSCLLSSNAFRFSLRGPNYSRTLCLLPDPSRIDFSRIVGVFGTSTLPSSDDSYSLQSSVQMKDPYPDEISTSGRFQDAEARSQHFAAVQPLPAAATRDLGLHNIHE